MQDKNYFIKVHGHSCLEIRSNQTSIIFDPWLSGSAYWRSWWNFPEPTAIESIIRDLSNCNEIFVYNPPTLGSFSWSNTKKVI